MQQSLKKWIDEEISDENKKIIAERGFDCFILTITEEIKGYNDLYLMYESEIELLLEEEVCRLDLGTSIEYTKEMSGIEEFESEEEYRMYAFQQAALILMKK